MAIYYVRKSGSDFNDGRSAAGAWGTLNKALRGGSGSFTAGSSTTLTTTGLTADQWIGATVTILTGTGAGSTGVVTVNSTTVFTVASWSGTAPSGAGTYAVTHLASGDTLYIGAGHYREAVTLTLTNPTSPVYIYGDPLGIYTGDAGEVIWSHSYFNNVGDNGNPLTGLIAFNGRSYINVKNITFFPTATNGLTFTGAETNIRVTRCAFTSYVISPIAIIVNAGITTNHVIEECIFYGSTGWITITPARHTADYSMNITVTKCIFAGNAAYAIRLITPTGTGVGYPGGLYVSECSSHWAASLVNADSITTYSATIPSTVRDSYSAFVLINLGTTGTVGSIVDLGGNVGTTVGGGTIAHPRSMYLGGQPAVFHSFGHEWLYGLPSKRTFSPAIAHLPPIGTSAISATDLTGRSRYDGCNRFVTSGTVTTATISSITDGGKAFGTNELKSYYCLILTGAQAGKAKWIFSNTATTLTFRPTSGNTDGQGGVFTSAPAAGDLYVIYEGLGEESGAVTSATATTFVDSTMYMYTRSRAFLNAIVEITDGTGQGQKRTVSTINGYPQTWTLLSGVTHTITCGGTVTGGTFSLQYNGKVTTPIAWNASAATVQAALEALSTIGAGNVSCTGGALPTTPVTVTFTNALANNDIEPILGFSRLTGTSPTLTLVGSWATTPDTTSRYVVYRRPDRAFIAAQPGALVAHDTARVETTITDAGTGIRLDGVGSQEFQIPVKANQAVTVSVKARYDSNYTLGTRPQLVLPAQEALGLSVQTATMTAAANTWETISLTFTPTATGIAIIRVIAQSTTSYGLAYFDSFSIT